MRLVMVAGVLATLLARPGPARAHAFLDHADPQDRSLQARGYTLLDLIARYRWRNLEASLGLLNLTNTDWREAQFADNSCVRSELGRAVGCSVRPGKQTQHTSDAVPSIHFTPGSPLGVRAALQLFF